MNKEQQYSTIAGTVKLLDVFVTPYQTLPLEPVVQY